MARNRSPRRAKRATKLEVYVDADVVDERGQRTLTDPKVLAALATAGEGLTRSRPYTIPLGRVAKFALRVLHDAYPEADEVHQTRPRDRDECRGGHRPCPFVSCKYNLFLDVDEGNGNIKLQNGGLEPWEVKESCSLDVADRRGGATLEEVGDLMNLSRERIRQLEDAMLARMKRSLILRQMHLRNLATDFQQQALTDHHDAEKVGG